MGRRKKRAASDRPSSSQVRRPRKRKEPEVEVLAAPAEDPAPVPSTPVVSCSMCFKDAAGLPAENGFINCTGCHRVAHSACVEIFGQWKRANTFADVSRFLCTACGTGGRPLNAFNNYRSRPFTGLEHLLMAVFAASGMLLADVCRYTENIGLLWTFFKKFTPLSSGQRGRAEISVELGLLRQQTGFVDYCAAVLAEMQMLPACSRLVEELQNFPQRNMLTSEAVADFTTKIVTEAFHQQLVSGSFGYQRQHPPLADHWPQQPLTHSHAELVIAVLHQWHIDVKNEFDLSLPEEDIDLAVTVLTKRGVVQEQVDGRLFGYRRIGFSADFLALFEKPVKSAVFQFANQFEALGMSTGWTKEALASPHVFQELLAVNPGSELYIRFPPNLSSSMYNTVQYKVASLPMDSLAVAMIKARTGELLTTLLEKLRRPDNIAPDPEEFVRCQMGFLHQSLTTSAGNFRAVRLQMEKIFEFCWVIYQHIYSAGADGLTKSHFYDLTLDNSLTEIILSDVQEALNNLLDMQVIVASGSHQVCYVAYVFQNSLFVPFPFLPGAGAVSPEVLLSYLRLILHFIWERGVLGQEEVVTEFEPFISERTTVEVLSILVDLELVTKYRLMKMSPGIYQRLDITKDTVWADEGKSEDTFFECVQMWRSLTAFQTVSEILSSQTAAYRFLDLA